MATAEAVTTGVEEWLGTVFTNPQLHTANIILGALLNGTNAVTGVRRVKGAGVAGLISDAIVAGIGFTTNLLASNPVSEAIYRQANSLSDEFKNPSIEGIPIHAIKEQESTDIDVAQKVIINQQYENRLAAQKDYYMDNAAPRPRTWAITGYLMANGLMSNLDARLIIKPSLVTQRALLQAYADSRKPVTFKTHDNRFYKVLIQHFDSAYDVQGLNSLGVNLQLIEYRTLDVSMADVALNIAEKVAQ